MSAELIVEAGDGRGGYWVHIALLYWGTAHAERSDRQGMVAQARREGERVRVAGGTCYVYMTEQRAEDYRRLAARILEGRRDV
jgi:hypothetical protein